MDAIEPPESMTEEQAEQRFKELLYELNKTGFLERFAHVEDALCERIEQAWRNITNRNAAARWNAIASGEPNRLAGWLTASLEVERAKNQKESAAVAANFTVVSMEVCGELNAQEPIPPMATTGAGEDLFTKLMQCVGGKISELPTQSDDRTLAELLRDIFEHIAKIEDLFKEASGDLNVSSLTREVNQRRGDSGADSVSRYKVDQALGMVGQYMKDCEREHDDISYRTRRRKATVGERIEAILSTPPGAGDQGAPDTEKEPSLEDLERETRFLQLLVAMERVPVRLSLRQADLHVDDRDEQLETIFTLDAAADDGQLDAGVTPFADEDEWNHFFFVVDDNQCTVEYLVPRGFELRGDTCELEYAMDDDPEVREVAARQEEDYVYVDLGDVRMLRHGYREACRRLGGDDGEVAITVRVPLQRVRR